MLLPNVLERAINHAASQQHTQEAESKNAHIIFLTPCAKHFTQSNAIRLATKEHIIFVCGRYEGIDERVIEAYADEVFCIGDFILTGEKLLHYAYAIALRAKFRKCWAMLARFKARALKIPYLKHRSLHAQAKFQGFYSCFRVFKGKPQ